MSTVSILACLDRLERALHIDEPEDNHHALERVLAQLDLIAERQRACGDWQEPTEAEKAAFLA
jgi:hypothetical protein